SYPVISGNTVTGKMVGTNCVNEVCNWEIDTTSISKGILRTSTLNYNSGSALYFLDGGVLEVYNVNNCGDYPPRGATPTTFNSFTIKDTTGTTITPTFSYTDAINDGCNESGNADSTHVSLYYGNTS
ncbi:MAG: hypothetical protein KGL95_06075, partial [Patescibacteria group bacterium]|nr:hypothetical protein [Patescibacteria group bacterium]